MLSVNRKKVWFGKLESPKATNTVMFDPEFPEPPKGKLYLYNVERGEVVQYVEDIVAKRLVDLSDEEIKLVESKLGAEWSTAKKEFLRSHGIGSRSAPASAPKTVRTRDEDIDTGDLDDDLPDFYDDDLDDE